MRSVFRTKLFCYRKENRSAKRFWNKFVVLWEREKKCEAFLQEICSVIGKKTKVRSVFGTKFFFCGKEKRSAKRCRNKIVPFLGKRREVGIVLEHNCFVAGKKTEVRSVFG